MILLTMEKITALLAIFSKTYPQLKEIEIEVIPYNNLFVARCLVDKIGEYIPVKKGRIHNIIPKKIILTTNAMEKQEQELLDKEQDEKDKQNLLLIKSKATMIYKENIEKNIIDYIIQNNNDNLKYENWLKLFSKSDWVNEFDEKGIHRENKIYHDIWDNITYEENGFVLLY